MKTDLTTGQKKQIFIGLFQLKSCKPKLAMLLFSCENKENTQCL